MNLRPLSGNPLPRALFDAPPERVARRLLGKLLAQNSKGSKPPIAGRIVEVEAYLGPHSKVSDPAAHSYRGPTPRNLAIFGPPGHAYVYSIYGRYFCMNVTCEPEGRAGCVLVRALEPVAGLEQMARNRGLAFPAAARDLTGGPSRLCQALGITRAAHNGLDLLDPASALQLVDDGVRAGKIAITRRIGIRHAVDLPLRFHIEGNGCVSGPRSMAAIANRAVVASQRDTLRERTDVSWANSPRLPTKT